MPAKKYRIELTTEEQQELKALVSKGRAAAYKQTHARILLLSDEARKDGGLTDEEVARSLEIASATVERIRRRCVEEGIEAALGRKEQQQRRPKKLDGAAEAHLIALACGEPPEGRARWTLRLLADRRVWRMMEANDLFSRSSGRLWVATTAAIEGITGLQIPAMIAHKMLSPNPPGVKVHYSG